MTSYCEVEDVKNLMPDADWGETYDTAFEQLALDASRLIDRSLRKAPGAFKVSEDSIRYFMGNNTIELWIGELANNPTTVEVAEAGDLNNYTAWAASDYLIWPPNALLDGMPFRRLDIDRLNGTKLIWPRYPNAIRITGPFGYSETVPEDLRRATSIQVVRWFKRGAQAFQDTGAIVDLRQLTFTKALDPEVALILDNFLGVTI